MTKIQMVVWSGSTGGSRHGHHAYFSGLPVSQRSGSFRRLVKAETFEARLMPEVATAFKTAYFLLGLNSNKGSMKPTG
jgi:hypothetical protein